MPYYAIINGRETGVVKGWPKCKASVSGYSNSWFRKFDKKAQALEYFEANKDQSDSDSDSNDGYVSGHDSIFGGSNYSYTESEESEESDEEHIYIDGACKGNGKVEYPPSGYGVFYGNNHSRNAVVALKEVTDVPGTNQRAELLALNHALDNISEDLQYRSSLKAYIIHTDSQYVIKATGIWAKKWESNGWLTVAGKPVANDDLIQDILYLLRFINGKLEKRGFPPVKIEYVPGHAGHYGNVMADKYANLGAEADAHISFV